MAFFVRVVMLTKHLAKVVVEEKQPRILASQILGVVLVLGKSEVDSC